MTSYTVDAVALLAYLVDALPQEADRARGTDAIVTSDAAIDDARDETVWR